MRILIVSQYFWPETFFLNDLVVGLKNKGHEITVLTGFPNYPEGKLYPGYSFRLYQKESYKGIDVVRVPIILRGRSGLLRLVANYCSYVISASIGVWFLRKKQFDVCYVFCVSPITQAFPALFLKFLKKTPVVLNVQDLWPESLTATRGVKAKWVLKIVAKMVQYIYRHADKIVVQSPGFFEPIMKLGASQDKILYLPNICPSVFREAVVTPSIQLLKFPEGFCILFAGNIGSAQDFPTIIRAAQLLKSCAAIHWIVLGGGSEERWLKKEIAQMGLDGCVHLMGKHPVETMPYYFSQADALLVSLKQDPIFKLTIPSKLQAYFGASKPIVACLDGVGACIVEDSHSGYAVPAGDSEALADAVMKLYNLPEHLRQEMGKNAGVYYQEHFDFCKIIDKLEQVLFDVGKNAL